MGNIKEMRLSVQSMLILMMNNMGMDTPENIEDITDFVLEDVMETADPIEWHNGDVAIAFRRWIEAQTKPDVDECTNGLNVGFYNKDNLERLYQKVKSNFNQIHTTPIDELQEKNNPKPIVVSLGDRIGTVGELRRLMSDLDANDIVCIEGIDLQTGDVEDLYPMNLDVIEGIKLNDGSIVREVRFCQMMNSAPDTRDKQPVIDALIPQIVADARHGDTTVLDVLLEKLPFEILLHSLPKKDWVKYRYLQYDEILTPASENIWSEIRSNYEDEGFIYIDAYNTPDDNISGTVIAKVRISDNHVIYLDERARDDKYAQEVITECFNRL